MLIFCIHKVELELLQSNGRSFLVSRADNGIADCNMNRCFRSCGTLSSITGDVRTDELTSEEIGLILLPASLFEPLTDNITGLLFLLYENASPFPVAGVSNDTRIGSPVIAATVVAGEQISFRDLEEPVRIVLRLNPVLEGVSCAHTVI